MSADDLDELMRHLAPPVTVAPERAALVVESVLARLDEPAFSRSRRSPLMSWLAGLVPVSRFAMPMAAAALLGVVVGQGLQPATDAALLDHLLTATSYTGLGY